jgi:hypothetical protein
MKKKTVGSIQKIMLNVRSSVACHVSVSSNVSTVDCQAFRSFNLEIINKQRNIKKEEKRKSRIEKLFFVFFVLRVRKFVRKEKRWKSGRKVEAKQFRFR